jgi:hypothetical protein
MHRVAIDCATFVSALKTAANSYTPSFFIFTTALSGSKFPKVRSFAVGKREQVIGIRYC